MHIYERLNSNIQNKIDYYIKKNNKILQKQINYEIIFYFFKKNINSIFKKNINFVNYQCTIF